MMRHYFINRYLRWCCLSIALLSSAQVMHAQGHLYADAKRRFCLLYFSVSISLGS
jgi:hypothetical protein